MNQHQRKFLLDAIDKQFRLERDALNSRKPSPPSLSNYLTASILDGAFVMKSPEEVRHTIRERVRDMGKGEALLSSSSRSFHRKRDEEDEECISLPAVLLFDLPPGYAEKMEIYNAEMEKWERESSALNSTREAMQLKVQIGSDKALEQLIDQADKLCSMSLTASSKLLIKNGGES